MNKTVDIKKIVECLGEAKKIYAGKDHACRCGCCGDYFDEKTDPEEFKRVKDEILELLENLGDDTEEIDDEWEQSGLINIPDPDYDNECYTLYKEA